MQPIPLLVAILLGLGALAYILFPLYWHPALQQEEAALPDQPGPGEHEQNARQALREVEFDFQLGNLDENDYRSLRTQYMRRALVEMKHRRQREEKIDAEIEEQLRTLKESERSEREGDRHA